MRYDRARRFLIHRTPCIACADDRADKRATAPWATPARTPVPRSALRAPRQQLLLRYLSLCGRGPLPLRALRRRLFSPLLVDIGTVDIRNCNPHPRTPHRRRHPSFAPPQSAVDQKTYNVYPKTGIGSHPQSPALSQATGVAGFTRDSSSATDTAVQDRRSPPVDPPRAVLVSRSTFPKRPLVGSEVRT